MGSEGHLAACLFGATLAMAGMGSFAVAQGVRVVDAVNVGLPRDEATHDLHGEAMTSGRSAGRTWRSATGWFGYVLRTYEDTPVTVVCVFADPGDAREAFDVFADDRKVASWTREPGSPSPKEWRVTVPLAETAGKQAITITLRAHAGSSTPRLLEIRTVQEHLE